MAGTTRRAHERSTSVQVAPAPKLNNPRHERFAQAFAKGRTQRQAYTDAGYSNPARANRLAKKPKVQARVAEIMEEAAVRAEISVAMVTGSLVRLAGKAEDKGAARDLTAARAAWMAAAKLNGLMAVRSEAAEERVGGIISDRPQTE
jgi:phage terminase small subunit